MLIPILPGMGISGDTIEGVARSFMESLTRIYEQNVAEYKEIKGFWCNPEARFREFALRTHEGRFNSPDHR